jgi:microcystin-dependent protein
MTYSITFTDSTNPSKPPITVADGALNTQTSLTFVGQSYSGYAPIIAGDFLHLLENFASATAPANPIQGQLWYDTSASGSILMIYDGTNWVEAGALKKAPFADAPSPSASVAGDLWVDTTNSQLYLFSGSQWLLVGPVYSTGLQTGPLVETFVDTLNISHPVISMYVNSATDNTSYRVAIISKDSFTPKTTISGFPLIKEGVNLYSNSLTGDSATVWGTVQNANALLVNNTSVAASNFLRGDVVSTTTNAFNIQNNGGLSLGTDLSFNISEGNTAFSITSKNPNLDIALNLNGTNVVYVDSSAKSVGIGQNLISPQTTLHVGGVITSGVSGTAGGLNITDSSYNSVLTVSPTGGLTTSLNSTFNGTVTIGDQIVISSSATAGPILLPPAPTSTPIYDIGSQSQPFRNVYANSFVGAFSGSFSGTFIGNVSGTAAALATPTVFTVAGDMISADTGVSFTGESITGKAILNTTVSSTMITGKTSATASYATDQMLVFQTTPSGSNLVSMTKQTFLQGVGAYAQPVGSIIAFAGPPTVIPDGWLMCDGSEISLSTYNNLFLVIGYMYGAQTTLLGTGTFKLPDLRGRFALGRDNMNNYGNVSGFVQAKDSTGTNVNTGGQIGPAGNVSNIAADTMGGYSGSQNIVLNTNQLPQHTHSLNDGTAQYYAPGLNGGITDPAASYGYSIGSTGTGYGLENTAGVNSASIGQAISVMNPYLTINYIIFTGNV